MKEKSEVRFTSESMQRYAYENKHNKLFNRLSCKERREDALALRADERRDKLR